MKNIVGICPMCGDLHIVEEVIRDDAIDPNAIDAYVVTHQGPDGKICPGSLQKPAAVSEEPIPMDDKVLPDSIDDWLIRA